jgi:hypothetical protein
MVLEAINSWCPCLAPCTSPDVQWTTLCCSHLALCNSAEERRYICYRVWTLGDVLGARAPLVQHVSLRWARMSSTAAFRAWSLSRGMLSTTVRVLISNPDCTCASASHRRTAAASHSCGRAPFAAARRSAATFTSCLAFEAHAQLASAASTATYRGHGAIHAWADRRHAASTARCPDAQVQLPRQL